MVVMGLKVVIGYAPVLDRHVLRNGISAIARGQMAAQHEFARNEAPGHAVPMRAGAAETVADRRDVPLAHWERQLRGGIAHRVGFDRGAEHQLRATSIFVLVST